MIASEDARLSLNHLQEGPPKTLEDALQAAKRLISKRTGIISTVEFENLASGEPSLYFARTNPSNSIALNGMETMNYGDAASIDPKRALMKAIGESIERYCPAHFNYEDFVFSTFKDLDCEATHPSDFALFSDKQYSEPNFPFTPMTESTPMHWVSAYSLSKEQPVMVPASCVYIPYFFNRSDEPRTHNPVSTGLACGSNLAPAIYKAILEVIERDAFMIMWQNQLPCPRIDLSTVQDPFNRSILNELERLPVECHAHFISTDNGVPVIVVILRNTTGQPPHTVIGMSADLNPVKALMLALEEVSLSWLGMGRYCLTKKDYQPSKDYKDANDLIRHALVHAMDPDLGKSWEFLRSSTEIISMQDIQNENADKTVDNIQTLVNKLKGNVIVKDLTTVDVEDVGFKVVRAVVPGMQHLDVSHEFRYLGGTRLYEVPHQMGLRDQPLTEEEVNPYPHMFP